MNYQQKLSVNVEKQESGYGLRLQLNSMPLDFIVRIIKDIEFELITTGESRKNNALQKALDSISLKTPNNWYVGDAYCVKCKDKKNFEGKVLVSDSGRRMAQGKCGDCGTKLNRILGKVL